MKVYVASTNPVKIDAVGQAFQQAFAPKSISVEGIGVPSGVRDQPMSEAETYQGAFHRVNNARQSQPRADFWVGIEGGMDRWEEQWMTFAWILLTDGQRWGKARTAGFFLPPEITDLVQEGVELGHANDQVFGSQNSKEKGGALGLLTHNLLNRTQLYSPAVLMALIPFLQAHLYFPPKGEGK